MRLLSTEGGGDGIETRYGRGRGDSKCSWRRQPYQSRLYSGWPQAGASSSSSLSFSVTQSHRLKMLLIILLPAYLVLLVAQLVSAVTLMLQVPPNIPALPPSTAAFLTARNFTLHTPITRANTFIFPEISSIHSTDGATSASATKTTSYLLDIACRDYDFAPYGVDVKSNGIVEIYRVSRGGIEQGEKVTVGDGAIELRVLKAREFYEKRGGCMLSPPIGKLFRGKGMLIIVELTVDPLAMLKNPMILIGIVGFAFVIGMPYLMDNSMFSSLLTIPAFSHHATLRMAHLSS